MSMLLDVHMGLLVVHLHLGAETANLVYVVPWMATSTFLLALERRVVDALLQMKEIVLLARLLSMGSVQKAQSAGNGMSLIVASSSSGTVSLGATVFFFTEITMAMSPMWEEPILRSPNEKQKRELRAKQARVFHWSHRILVKYVCRWNFQASRWYKSNSTGVSVSDFLP